MNAELGSLDDDLISESVFAELGRLTYAAIKLEDVTRAAVRWIDPALDNLSVRRLIERAQQILATWPQSEDRDFCDQWLENSSNALLRRNEVIHSTPAIYVELIDAEGGMNEVGPILEHNPRFRDQSAGRTWLTVDDLAPVTAQLRTARAGWWRVATKAEDQRDLANPTGH